MPRFHHGVAFNEGEVAAEAAAGTTTGRVLATAPQLAEEESHFGFLFPKLQENGDALLTEGPTTVEKLVALGEAMADTSDDTPANNSKLPAVFTYFGQFIAHDITWEKGTKDITNVSKIEPWTRAQVEAIVNKRSGSLDLDCVYGDSTFKVPRMPDGQLQVDFVVDALSVPDAKRRNDVPRKKDFLNPKEHGVPIIGDPRNDENTIISQLHVAFLRAHNKLMEKSQAADPLTKFAEARTQLVQLYQTILVEDFLKRIIRPDIFATFRDGPDLLHDGSFMPVEFSAAGFRFGHTMIRTEYALNKTFFHEGQRLRLGELFEMPPFNYYNLPASWIIEWEHFVDGKTNLARKITTQMVEPLSLLKDSPDNPFKKLPRLAVRDLLRGYIFRLPTGQSVAREIGVKEEEIITGDQFKNLDLPASQLEILSTSEFHEKTPLWFYLLAEAAREKKKGEDEGKDYLGPVGSHIVARTLRGSLLKSEDSILQKEDSQLGSALTDLFRLAGVLPDANPNP